MTQSMIDLEVAHTLVGVTEYCPQPEVEPLAKVIGGTHSIEIEEIKKLEPELVIANQEENDREDVEALEEIGIKVWVTFPKTIQAAIQILWAMARLFDVMGTAAPKILLIERSLEWVQRAMGGSEPRRIFVPIWQEDHPELGTYWMTFNAETYCDSVINTCGGLNVFRERRRRYPLEAEFEPALEEQPGKRDTRYPRVSAEEIVDSAPELILLPSEPFTFGDQHKAKISDGLAETPAVRNENLIEVDGRWLSWHGTAVARALAGLPTLLA
jgi:ABC-type Fe3+-hydroxamate transport system substrate-binding protein